MKKILSFILLGLMCSIGNLWAETAAYVPLGLKTVTVDEVVYCTDITAAGDPATSWVVVPNYGTDNRSYTNTNNDDKGNPTGIVDNLATTADNVAMIQIKKDGNTYSAPNRVVHMHVKGVETVIAHGFTGSSGRGMSIAVAEFSNDLSTFPTSGIVSVTRSGNNGSMIVKKDGLDASKEYIISIYAVSGDTRFYAVEFFVPGLPSITTQPEGASYVIGDAISPISVVAEAAAGSLSYQWYSCDDAEKTNAAAIDGATNASYTPSAAGFYYVVVTDDNGNVTSDVVEIVISAASAPTISVSGAPVAPIIVGAEVTLTAEMTGVPSPTIQWYSCEDVLKTNPAAIDGATNETYAPSTEAAGTFYYYAVATNSQGNAASSVQTIVVKEKVATPTFTPNGAYFEGTQSVTIACATDGAAIVYSIDNGVNWSPYSAALIFSETTTVKAKATKDGYFDSEIATATFTYFAKNELVAISTNKTWTIPTSLTLELKDDGTTTPAKYDEYYTYADIATINGHDLGEFDGTTLAFSGQYPYRGSNGAQNGILQFKTTVPGKVTVEFSNTGGSNKERWVKVNETTGIVEADGTTKRNEDFKVAAGTVTISHVNKDGNLSNGLRFFSIVFTPDASITLGANGYSTYAADFKYTVSGAEVYKAAYNGSDVVTLTKVADAVVPANEGIILVGEEGAKVYFAESSESASDFEDNELVGVLTAAAAPANAYALATNLDGDGLTKFHPCTGIEIPANKAYIIINGLNPAPSLRIIFAENGATGINELEGAEKAVKFIENGKLYIQKDGVVYDATGAKVK